MSETKSIKSETPAAVAGAAPCSADLEALRQSVQERGELSEALHEIAKWCFDLTLTCCCTDGVNEDIRKRAYKAHRVMLQYRQKYDLRSRAEVERGERDGAIDAPNYHAFGQPNADLRQDADSERGT